MKSFFCRCGLLALLGWLGLAQPSRAQGRQPKPKAAPPGPYQAVDARMCQVPDSSARTAGGLARFIKASFATEGDRARAAFVWVARNIRYDVENMYVLDLQRKHPTTTQETLEKRRGVCQHYAELYGALANQSGVLTYVVLGCTNLRDQAGHAWCASRIDGQWALLDPTWAAGRVENEKFTFHFADDFFRMAPAVFITTHMPFDPLWQLLPAPRTPQQFQQGTRPAAPRVPFAFADSVTTYARQSPEQQLRAATRRVEQNGVKNDLTYNYVLNSRQLESDRFVDAFNEVVEAYNAATTEFNTFAVFFSHQFLPHKTDEELRQLLNPLAADVAKARRLLATAHPVIPAQKASLVAFQVSLQLLETKLRDGQAFVERYQHTTKILRLMLFGNPAATGSLTR